MKFPFRFKAAEITITTTSAAPSWAWPSCINYPKTLSFRANTTDNIYKTINSVYVPEFADDDIPDSFFSICNSFGHHHREGISSFESEISDLEQPNNVESAVISGLMSDRLFFEPGETNSIMKEAKTHKSLHTESVGTMVIPSNDPFLDFRVSMEEVVEAHGLKDWEFLEELLECYLRVNDKSNHGYIVGAFVDLFSNIAMISPSNDSAIDENCSSSTTTTTQYSFTSPLSFSSSTFYSSTSPCLSSAENNDEIVDEKNGDNSSSLFLSIASSLNV